MKYNPKFTDKVMEDEDFDEYIKSTPSITPHEMNIRRLEKLLSLLDYLRPMSMIYFSMEWIKPYFETLRQIYWNIEDLVGTDDKQEEFNKELDRLDKLVEEKDIKLKKELWEFSRKLRKILQENNLYWHVEISEYDIN